MGGKVSHSDFETFSACFFCGLPAGAGAEAEAGAGAAVGAGLAGGSSPVPIVCRAAIRSQHGHATPD
jgi:hypothetical protein